MRSHIFMAALSCIAVGYAATLAGCTSTLTSQPGVAPDRPFAVAPAEVDGLPGSIVSKEAIGAPEGAFAAYRVVYRSRDADQRPVVVSGIIVVPSQVAPGRPVIAWAHPTTGVVPRCAPSLSPLHFSFIPGLKDMLERGFIVTATDYQGLGTEGPHPFLVGVSEAHAVLDSVRAARLLPGGAGARFGVWGHSQGGHAALFTAMTAHKYAPELELAGVAAASPATDLATLFRQDADTAGGRNITVLTLWSWSQVYGVPMDSVVESAAMPAVKTVAGECIGSLRTASTRSKADNELAQTFLKVADLTATPPWNAFIKANSVGALPSGLPVFLAQGTADTLVDPGVTKAYAKRLCRDGNRVQLDMLEGVQHGFAAFKSAQNAVAWLAARFAAQPAPDDCPAIIGG